MSKKKHFLIMADGNKRIFVFLVVAMLLSFTFSISHSQAQVTEVSDPGKANKILSDFSTPIIKPSEKGELAMNLTNLYWGDLEDIVFVAEIYGFATLDYEKNISKVDNPPVFDSSGTTKSSFSLEVLPSNGSMRNEYTIKTNKNTPKGVYFLRFNIRFTYGPTDNRSVMRSKGYFTDSQWENATKRPTTSDESYYAGSINITHLGVNGIIPDSSFTVKTPIPRWPQYALGGLSAVFGILAVMLYMQEEYNSFPWLEDILNEWSGKLKQLRRRLEHRLRNR